MEKNMQENTQRILGIFSCKKSFVSFITIFILLSILLSQSVIAVNLCPTDKFPTEIAIEHSRHPKNIVLGVTENTIDIKVALVSIDLEGAKIPLAFQNIVLDISILDKFVQKSDGTYELSDLSSAFIIPTDKDGIAELTLSTDELFPGKKIDPRKISYSITASYSPETKSPYMGSVKTENYAPSEVPLISLAACLPLVLVLGLLMMAMSATGKDPFAMLDISRFAFKGPAIRRAQVKGRTITPIAAGIASAALQKPVMALKRLTVTAAKMATGLVLSGTIRTLGLATKAVVSGTKLVAKAGVSATRAVLSGSVKTTKLATGVKPAPKKEQPRKEPTPVAQPSVKKPLPGTGMAMAVERWAGLRKIGTADLPKGFNIGIFATGLVGRQTKIDKIRANAAEKGRDLSKSEQKRIQKLEGGIIALKATTREPVGLKRLWAETKDLGRSLRDMWKPIIAPTGAIEYSGLASLLSGVLSLIRPGAGFMAADARMQSLSTRMAYRTTSKSHAEEAKDDLDGQLSIDGASLSSKDRKRLEDGKMDLLEIRGVSGILTKEEYKDIRDETIKFDDVKDKISKLKFDDVKDETGKLTFDRIKTGQIKYNGIISESAVTDRAKAYGINSPWITNAQREEKLIDARTNLAISTQGKAGVYMSAKGDDVINRDGGKARNIALDNSPDIKSVTNVPKMSEEQKIDALKAKILVDTGRASDIKEAEKTVELAKMSPSEAMAKYLYPDEAIAGKVIESAKEIITARDTNKAEAIMELSKKSSQEVTELYNTRTSTGQLEKTIDILVDSGRAKNRAEAEEIMELAKMSPSEAMAKYGYTDETFARMSIGSAKEKITGYSEAKGAVKSVEKTLAKEYSELASGLLYGGMNSNEYSDFKERYKETPEGKEKFKNPDFERRMDIYFNFTNFGSSTGEDGKPNGKPPTPEELKLLGFTDSKDISNIYNLSENLRNANQVVADNTKYRAMCIEAEVSPQLYVMKDFITEEFLKKLPEFKEKKPNIEAWIDASKDMVKDPFFSNRALNSPTLSVPEYGVVAGILEDKGQKELATRLMNEAMKDTPDEAKRSEALSKAQIWLKENNVKPQDVEAYANVQIKSFAILDAMANDVPITSAKVSFDQRLGVYEKLGIDGVCDLITGNAREVNDITSNIAKFANPYEAGTPTELAQASTAAEINKRAKESSGEPSVAGQADQIERAIKTIQDKHIEILSLRAGTSQYAVDEAKRKSRPKFSTTTSSEMLAGLEDAGVSSQA